MPPSAPPPAQPPAPASSAEADRAVSPASNGAAELAAVALATAPAPVALDIDRLRSVWPAVIEAVKAGNGFCAALLERAKPIAVEGAQVTIAFAPAVDADFLLRKVNDDEYRQCVVAALRAVTGNKTQVSYVLAELPAEQEHAEAVVAPPTEDEWVRRFVAEFDAEEILPHPDEPDLRPPS